MIGQYWNKNEAYEFVQQKLWVDRSLRDVCVCVHEWCSYIGKKFWITAFWTISVAHKYFNELSELLMCWVLISIRFWPSFRFCPGKQDDDLEAKYVRWLILANMIDIRLSHWLDENAVLERFFLNQKLN